MPEFLSSLVAWPTAVFTVGLGSAAMYWLLVIVGMFDPGLHGAADAHDAGHGAGHAENQGGGLDSHGFWHGFLDFLAVGTVPISFSATLVLLVGWVLCMLANPMLAPLATTVMPTWLFGTLLLIAVLAVALPLAAIGLVPFRSVFKHLSDGGQIHKRDLVGRIARITSATADRSFGTATCDYEGDEHVIHVITRDDLRFSKGDQVVVVDYDDDADRFLVGPAPHLTSAVEPAQPHPAAPATQPSSQTTT
jgi:membrane protein implicated in regulation of membrane protease activity